MKSVKKRTSKKSAEEICEVLSKFNEETLKDLSKQRLNSDDWIHFYRIALNDYVKKIGYSKTHKLPFAVYKKLKENHDGIVAQILKNLGYIKFSKTK